MDVRIGRPSTDSQEPAHTHTAKAPTTPPLCVGFLLSRRLQAESSPTKKQRCRERPRHSPTRLLGRALVPPQARSARFASPGPGKPGLAHGRACHTPTAALILGRRAVPGVDRSAAGLVGRSLSPSNRQQTPAVVLIILITVQTPRGSIDRFPWPGRRLGPRWDAPIERANRLRPSLSL